MNYILLSGDSQGLTILHFIIHSTHSFARVRHLSSSLETFWHSIERTINAAKAYGVLSQITESCQGTRSAVKAHRMPSQIMESCQSTQSAVKVHGVLSDQAEWCGTVFTLPRFGEAKLWTATRLIHYALLRNNLDCKFKAQRFLISADICLPWTSWLFDLSWGYICDL